MLKTSDKKQFPQNLHMELRVNVISSQQRSGVHLLNPVVDDRLYPSGAVSIHVDDHPITGVRWG